MTTNKFQIHSKYDDLSLSVLAVEPDGERKGIVQIAHGMAEKKERYLDFMTFLAECGYVAVCHDHRGHGESMVSAEDRGWFGDYTAQAVVDDTVQVTEYVKKLYPELPVILFGHSMGSMIVRCYAQEHDELIDKLIVCGSPSKNSLAGMAILVEKVIRLFRGARYKSKTLKHLSTGEASKRFQAEGSGAWLSRDREHVEKYIADPNCGFIFTCNGYENLFKLLKYTYQKKKYKVKNPDLPVLFVAGGEDPIIVDEVKWLKSIEMMRELGYEVSGKLYEGMRHEILNEIGKEEVYADLLKFIEK